TAQRVPRRILAAFSTLTSSAQTAVSAKLCVHGNSSEGWIRGEPCSVLVRPPSATGHDVMKRTPASWPFVAIEKRKVRRFRQGCQFCANAVFDESGGHSRAGKAGLFCGTAPRALRRQRHDDLR